MCINMMRKLEISSENENPNCIIRKRQAELIYGILMLLTEEDGKEQSLYRKII